MTTRWPWIIRLTTICCLLPLATSASAKGAWILWHGQTANGKSERLNMYGAYPDFMQCDTEVKRILAEARTRVGASSVGHVGTAVTHSMIVTFREGGSAEDSLIDSYQCLPDTVDPRGPKGK